ncbi:MAG: HEPN domain-containing protein [Planctomycetes bacterium RBG_16_55_9]|nr:MAG: HEPN domain-containing protein [Planctomycetes bacterium RBG_16_55_9]
MNDSRSDLINYRIQRAREALEDARLLANAGRWNASVNRLYYACFYAVSALLIKDGLSSSKHSGVRGLFNQHYVKIGKVGKETAKIYNDLFERRQESDYVDFIRFEQSQVQPWISQAEAFVKQVETAINPPDRNTAEN